MPATEEPSQTPVPHTATIPPEATMTQLPTAPAQPFTEGNILILWNKALTPSPDEVPGCGQIE